MNPIHLFQLHPNPNLRRHWYVIQIGLLLLPFSPLIGGLSILLTAIVVCSREYHQLWQRPVTWGICGLTGWMLWVTCLATDPPEAFLGLYHFFIGFIVFLGSSPLFQTVAQLQQFARLLLLSSVPVVIIGFGQLFWGWAGHAQFLGIVVSLVMDPGGTPPGRMASIFAYANSLASFLVIVFPLGMGLWLEQIKANFCPSQSQYKIKPGLVSALQFLAVLGALVAIVLTYSRNAWGITSLHCLMFVFYLGWWWLGSATLLLISSILGSAWGPDPVRQWLRLLIPSYFWLRLSGEISPNYDVALRRSTQWQFALTLIEQRPWVGWGLRSFPSLYQEHTGVFLGHPHSLVIMLTAEMGGLTTILLSLLVGGILYRGVSFWLQWPQIEAAKTSVTGHLTFFSYLMAFLACILFNLVDVTLFDVRINLLGWLVLAAIYGLSFNHLKLSSSTFQTKS